MNIIKINATRAIMFLPVALLYTACAPRIPFSQTLRDQHKLTNEELKNIQFFVSHDIVLYRGEKSEQGKETTQGTLTIKDDKSVEQVIIKAGTPGLVEQVIDGQRIAVGFEEGEGKYLVFGDPAKKGKYSLLAAEWDSNNRGKVEYGGKTYYTNPGASNIFITFQMKHLSRFRQQQQVAKGKKLSK